MSFCERLWDASPMSSRAKASWLQDGPAADQGWAHQQHISVPEVTFLRTGEKTCSENSSNCRWRKEWEYTRETALHTHQGQWKRERRCSRQRFPCRPRWVSYPPLAQGTPWWSRAPPAGSLATAGGRPKKAVTREQAPGRTCEGQNLHWSRFAVWIYLWPWRESIMEQPVPDRLNPVKVTHAGGVGEGLEPLRKTHIGEIHGGLFPVGVAPKCRRGRVWGERSDRDKVWWTDCSLHSLTLCTLGRRIENLGVKMRPTRGECVWSASVSADKSSSNLILYLTWKCEINSCASP